MINLKQYTPHYQQETLVKISAFFNFHDCLIGSSDNVLNCEAALATLNEWTKTSDHELYRICADDYYVGFLHIWYKGAIAAWIEDIFVNESFRSKGYATAALKIAEDIIKAKEGYQAACLDVSLRNTAALHLYHKLGYNSASLITLRKEFGKNKRDRKADILNLEFNV